MWSTQNARKEENTEMVVLYYQRVKEAAREREREYGTWSFVACSETMEPGAATATATERWLGGVTARLPPPLQLQQ